MGRNSMRKQMMDKIPSPNDPRKEDPSPREPLRVEARSALRIRDEGRTRQLTGDAAIDPFDISDIMAKYAPTGGDPARGNIDNEIDFNWKRYEVYGERNFSEWLTNERQGWRAVQHSDFP